MEIKEKKEQISKQSKKGQKNGTIEREKMKRKENHTSKTPKAKKFKLKIKWGKHQRLRSLEKDAKMARCEKVEKKAKSF